MGITVKWSQLGLGALLVFLIGWLLFGLLAATVLAIVVLVFMGVIRFTPDRSRRGSDPQR